MIKTDLPIYLASRSPRRRKLLKQMGIKFKSFSVNLDEKINGGEKPVHLVKRLSIEKLELARKKIKSGLIITADTIVWCNDMVLDKPVDPSDAGRILREISGNTHEVITGVALLSANRETSFYSSTKVTFEKLSDEEIDFYVQNFKPYDKAGAYGIQEWIGIAACSRIEGSYFNVMGLPVQQVYQELKKFVKIL